MHPILNIAIRAIRKGGSILVQNYDIQQQSITESNLHRYKFLNNIIQYSEKVMSDIISRFYPKHCIINKRSIKVIPEQKKNFWVINTIDGTINYSKNFPHFCISMSIYLKGTIEVSVIYDPLKNELFSSVKGQGSRLNGYRIRCKDNTNINSVGVAVDFSKMVNNSSWFIYKNMFKKLLTEGCYIRCFGSMSLDLAYVASGRINCYLGFKDDAIMFSIGELQIIEAGGLIINLNDILRYNAKNNLFLIGSPRSVKHIISKLN